MRRLISEWQKSFYTIFSFDGLIFCKNVSILHLRSFKVFLEKFWWLLLIDALLFVTFGKEILETYSYASTETSSVNFFHSILYLFYSTLWFIIPTALMLVIKNDGNIDKYRFKYELWRCIQLSLILIFLGILSCNILSFIGISSYPKIHWSLGIVIHLLEFLMIFYWLDSSCRLKDIFYALENSLNLILYRIPFFVVLFIFWVLTHTMVSFFIPEFKTNADFYKLLGGTPISRFFELSSTPFTIIDSIKIVFIRYGVFFINYIFISIVYYHYSQRRRERYAQSLLK